MVLFTFLNALAVSNTWLEMSQKMCSVLTTSCYNGCVPRIYAFFATCGDTGSRSRGSSSIHLGVSECFLPTAWSLDPSFMYSSASRAAAAASTDALAASATITADIAQRRRFQLLAASATPVVVVAPLFLALCDKKNIAGQMRRTASRPAAFGDGVGKT